MRKGENNYKNTMCNIIQQYDKIVHLSDCALSFNLFTYNRSRELRL